MSWLKQAIAAGAWDIPFIRQDPDLMTLRKKKPKEFADLVAVKSIWNIKFDPVWDDLWLRNDSPFPLTNVVLEVRLEQDQQVWTPVLTAPEIAPGQTVWWRDEVSVPGGWLSRKSATIACDQNR